MKTGVQSRGKGSYQQREGCFFLCPDTDCSRIDLLDIFLTNYNEITSLILCDLEEYIENNCELIIDSDPIILFKEVTRARFTPEWADSGHRSDFKFYIDHNDIIIKFNDNETDEIIIEGRMNVGYDEQNNPTFIRIKNLTEEEYSQLIQRLEEKEVPMKI